MKRLKLVLKRAVFFGLTLVCFIAKAQDSHKLSGRITDCKWKMGIAYTTVKLVSRSGINVETLSDSLGYYYFNDSVLKPNTAFIITTRAPVTEESKLNFGKCPYYPCYSNKEYFNSSDKVKFKIDDVLSKEYVNDFCLVEALHCGWSIPTIYFKKNTTDFDLERVIEPNRYSYGADTSFDCCVGVMLCNPSYVFEISGHADKAEKNGKELAESRVNFFL